MSYKIKSLLYFLCFVASAIMYYSMDNEIQTTVVDDNVDLAEADMADITSGEALEFEDVK